MTSSGTPTSRSRSSKPRDERATGGARRHQDITAAPRAPYPPLTQFWSCKKRLNARYWAESFHSAHGPPSPRSACSVNPAWRLQSADYNTGHEHSHTQKSRTTRVASDCVSPRQASRYWQVIVTRSTASSEIVGSEVFIFDPTNRCGRGTPRRKACIFANRNRCPISQTRSRTIPEPTLTQVVLTDRVGS